MYTSENVRELIKKITTILQLFCPGKRVIVTNQYPYLFAITGIEPIGLFHHLPRLTKQNHNKLPNSFTTNFILISKPTLSYAVNGIFQIPCSVKPF